MDTDSASTVTTVVRSEPNRQGQPRHTFCELKVQYPSQPGKIGTTTIESRILSITTDGRGEGTHDRAMQYVALLAE